MMIDLMDSTWKLAVHALNVLRLVITDSSLAPYLNRYVSDVFQLAVQGFKASQWSLRNSSMMVFTAVTQLIVSSDRNDSSGASVPTAKSFFTRFPLLEPFIASELGLAVGIGGSLPSSSSSSSSSSKGISVAEYPSSHAAAVYPTLYPLLLLLAKLRAVVSDDDIEGDSNPMEHEVVTNANVIMHDDDDHDHDDATDSSRRINNSRLQELCSIVGTCSYQKVQAVRVVAARALRSLTAISDCPAVVRRLLHQLDDYLSNVERSSSSSSSSSSSEAATSSTQSSSSSLNFNYIHGTLLSVRELLYSIQAYLKTTAITFQATDLSMSMSHKLHDSCLAILVNVFHRLLITIRCEPIHYTMLETIVCIRSIFHGIDESNDNGYHTINELFVLQCQHTLRSIYMYSAPTIISLPPPYAALLWKQTTRYFVEYSLITAWFSRRDKVESSSDDDPSDPSDPSQSRLLGSDDIYHLMDHPISEVREGTLLGFISVMDDNDADDDDHAGAAAMKKPWISMPLISRVEVLLQKLLTRLAVEREPPVIKLLFDIIIAIISTTSLHDFSPSLQAYVRHDGIGILNGLIVASPLTLQASDDDDIMMTSDSIVLKSKPSVYCSIEVR